MTQPAGGESLPQREGGSGQNSRPAWREDLRPSRVAVSWFLLGLLLAAVAGATALLWLAWEEANRAQGLRAELEAAQSERASLLSDIRTLQDTTASLQDRLATLEANDPARRIMALQEQLEASGDPQSVRELQGSLAEVQTKVDGLQSSLDSLTTRFAALEASDPTRLSEVRLSVARQRQSHNLSCEASAASMVAQYLGSDLTEADVLAALPRNADPHLGFRGNVDGPTGGIQDYGVYAEPIAAVLEGKGLQARPVDGGLDGIKAAIARGNPVIAWVTYDLRPSIPTTTTIDSRQVTLIPYEHVVVVTGYNANGFWANNPWNGEEDFYSAADLTRALSYLGNMALEVGRP